MKKNESSNKYLWRQRRKRRFQRRAAACLLVILLAAAAVFWALMSREKPSEPVAVSEKVMELQPAVSSTSQNNTEQPTPTVRSYDDRGPEFWKGAPEIDDQLLTPNEYSRPQLPLYNINAIVIHYTANPGSTAQDNRDYFEELKEGTGTYASSHFVIGIDGKIIQCIPSTEMSYTSNDRNTDSMSIECCHPDESGKFTDETYKSLVDLTAWLCKAFQVPPENVIRHYDVTGKPCPKYYVENEEAWLQLKADIKEAYDKLLEDA